MKLPKRVIFVAKLLIMLGIAGVIAWQLSKTWGDLARTHLHLDWRFGALGVLSFGGVFVSSGLVWRWLAWRMGDRHPTLPLLGAYTFSQLGKYVPGKVMLLFMRIERARRVGMDATTCTVATLVENAMYIVSGGLVATATLLVYVRDHPAYIAGVAVMMAAMLALFYPPVFYRLVNGMLVKVKQAPVAPEQQLPLRTLLLAVVLFVPCWLFGGLAIWSAARCLGCPMTLHGDLILPGAFAFSVIGGMVMALTPGGLGTREAVLILFLGPVLTPPIATIVAVVQRLLQMIAEAILGGAGALVTARHTNDQTPPPAGAVPDEATLPMERHTA